ncbi:MAG: hypothetical protein JWO76_226 [Nocardioides sp.]|nr:hypothetical protein [Nocardioides sp.]
MISYIWEQGAIWSILIALTLSLAAGVAWARRRGTGRDGRVLGFLVALPVAAIPAATLGRYGRPDPDLTALVHWAPGGWLRFSTDLGRSEEILLNIALFVPAGAVLALVLRRPAATWAALIGLSLVIEAVQGVLGLGSPDLSDVLANSVGAFVGVLLGTAAACVRAEGRRTSLRRLGVLLGAALVLALLVPVGAARREHRFDETLRARFAGTTVADYRRWSRQDTLGKEVFTVDHVYSDGASAHAGSVSVRYPTSFLGIHQCAIATWTSDGFAVARRTGSACTVFLG